MPPEQHPLLVRGQRFLVPSLPSLLASVLTSGPASKFLIRDRGGSYPPDIWFFDVNRFSQHRYSFLDYDRMFLMAVSLPPLLESLT